MVGAARPVEGSSTSCALSKSTILEISMEGTAMIHCASMGMVTVISPSVRSLYQVRMLWFSGRPYLY